jgi:hypothetical protein
LVSELAGSFVVLHHLVVEDGEVECETELDGVARGEGDLVGFIVSLEGGLLDSLHLGTLCVLSDVAVVVADHLHEESLGLTVTGLGENLLVDHVNNTLAVTGELGLDRGLVSGECGGILGVLGVLLDGSNSAAGSALGADEVFEGNRKEVALVTGDFSTFGVKDEGKEIDHILKTFCLLGNTC